MPSGAVPGHELGAAVRELVPPALVPVVIAVTYLGSTGLVLAVLALGYWLGDRDRGAHALGIALGGMATVVALKSLFAVPRPPDTVAVVHADGFGFPSGHALAATVAYGVLAVTLEVGTDRQRFGAAATLVVAVALSRVVLGVHYLRDVVAGVAFGVAFLAVAVRLTRGVPRAGFQLAAVVSVLAALLSAGSQDGAAVLGASLGAILAWEGVDTTTAVESQRRRVALLGGVLPGLGVLGYASTVPTVHPVGALALSGAGLAGVLAAPALVSRMA
jgi:membrane-associated phospholipid phosphatase